jgi:hypothetical protein
MPSNKALHRTAIPLRSIAADEIGRSPSPFLSLHRHGILMPLDGVIPHKIPAIYIWFK